ncbi:unnamed protein product [Rotaria sp. Silwood1]|nr:unnamed protein product [Rotaria sp. Silwood1]
MISTESKFYTSKNSISESLQIRTNKHRCFVFCIGHTSLTCVPGIGKKNKYLLNQSGIHDLTTLYSKYRSINNIENFKQWLENDIGFTSYQAKMTTCGLSTKLGKIQELDKGLIPICCSTKERREEKYKLLFHNKNINKRIHNMKLINEKNKKLKIEKNKSKSLLTNSSYDQIESLKLFNTLTQEETSLLPHEVSFGEKFKVNIDSIQSTKQNSSSLDMNNIQNIDSNQTTTSHEFPKINLLLDSEHSKQLEINQIHNKIDKTLSTIESSNISELQQSKDNRDQQMKINYSKEITTNSIPQEFDSISSSELPIENKAQSNEYSQDYVINQSDSSMNKSQQNQFQEQIEKIVRRIMKQATHIVSEVHQSSQANTILFTKANSIELSSIQMPIFEMKNSNDKAQSIILSQRQDDQHRTTPSKCIPLAEQLAQTGSKKLTTTLESNSNDVRSLQLLEQDSSTQSNSIFQGTRSIISRVIDNSLPNSNKNDSLAKLGIQNNEKIVPVTAKQQLLVFFVSGTTELKPQNLESLQIKCSHEKRSLSTLSSLSSSSMQSIHNINSFIDKVQTNSTDKNYFEKETNSIIKHDYVLLNTSTSKNKFESISTSNLNQISDFTTEISMNRISTEHHKQTSLLTTTLFNDNKKYKLNTTTMIPFYHLNQLPISQKIKDNEFINKNLSEIITENEILDRIFNPSTPKSCYPIWNNISNEKLLSQHKNNHLILIEKDKFSKENNHNDHNQNYHSSTTLFTFITRQQYAKEQQTLNEHILYVKQTKPLYKSS